MVRITSEPIQLAEILSFVSSGKAGAIDVFLGTSRANSDGKGVLYLDYEAYEPMARAKMEELEAQAKHRWPVEHVAIVHRIGRVDIGESSVAIAVSSAHRNEAFEACRFLIDRLKQEVPIWKKEHFADGTIEWGGASPEQSEDAHTIQK